MKKFIALFCAAAVLAFAGMAFAEAGHGGHVVPVTPETGNYVGVVISSKDVTVPGATTSPDVQPLAKESLPTSAAKYDITPGTSPVLLQGFVLSFDHAAGASGDITLSADINTNVKFAWITTSADKNVLYRYNVTGKAIKNVNYDNHFTDAKVILGYEKAVPTGGGGSSGCNAGFAGLLLLAAAPLLYFRKK